MDLSYAGADGVWELSDPEGAGSGVVRVDSDDDWDDASSGALRFGADDALERAGARPGDAGVAESDPAASPYASTGAYGSASDCDGGSDSDGAALMCESSGELPQIDLAALVLDAAGGCEGEDGLGGVPCRVRSSGKSSGALFTSKLKKGWKAVKKTGVKSTASAGKSLTSLSSTYWKSYASSASAAARAGAPQTEADRDAWEARQTRIGDEWITSILPSWRKKRKTARVRTLAFRGIPASVRGRVWQVALGNPLNVSEELFDVLKDRAYAGRMEYLRGRETIDKADGDVGGHGGQAESMLVSERSAHKAIMLDLPRTFPELAFFHAKGSHYEEALRDILEAFVYLRPDIGYSQGMSFLGAVLLLYMDPAESFSCFVTMLLYKSCFLHFFSIKMPEVRIYLTVHSRLLAEEMPALDAHFRKHGVEADLYMINWVMSLFCRALPLDLVSRIWDVYVLDGDVVIFRAALGILKMFLPRLLEMGFEDMAYFLSHLPADEMEADKLLSNVRSVHVVTRRRFKDLFRECEASYRKEEKLSNVENCDAGRQASEGSSSASKAPPS